MVNHLLLEPIIPNGKCIAYPVFILFSYVLKCLLELEVAYRQIVCYVVKYPPNLHD